MSKNVNLLIIGFQKCGSSSLFELLCSHPKIQGTKPKETFFLTDSIYENYSAQSNFNLLSASWSEYFDANSVAKYYLEGSVNSFYQNTAKKYVQEYPDTKIIFVLRDPVDRFVSNYNYYKSRLLRENNFVDLNGYIHFVNSGNGNYSAIDFALEHGMYSKHIDDWSKRVDSSNILLVGFNEIKNNSTVLVNRLAKFLEIDEERFDFSPPVNKSKIIRNPKLHRFLYSSIGGRTFPMKKTLSKLYRRVSFTKKKEELSEDNLFWLREYYKQEYLVYSEFF